VLLVVHVDGNRLRLWTAATNGPVVHPCDYEYGEPQWYDIDKGKLKNSKKNLVPVPLSPPQISYWLTRTQTQPSAVRGQRLTAWAMAQPSLCFSATVWRRVINLNFMLRPCYPLVPREPEAFWARSRDDVSTRKPFFSGGSRSPVAQSRFWALYDSFIFKLYIPVCCEVLGREGPVPEHMTPPPLHATPHQCVVIATQALSWIRLVSLFASELN
jgi:hypothetical protein